MRGSDELSNKRQVCLLGISWRRGPDAAVFSLGYRLDIEHLPEGQTVLISLGLLPAFGLRMAVVICSSDATSVFLRQASLPHFRG